MSGAFEARPTCSGVPTTVRARAPLRLGLAGGGTDLSPYCDEFGGCVLNAAITRHAYATLEVGGEPGIRFVSHDLGSEECIAPGQMPSLDAGLRLHRAAFRWAMQRDALRRPPDAMTLTTSVQCPVGSGLGASSAIIVALLQCLAHYIGVELTADELAYEAFQLERRELGLVGGRQDQYAAAHGGMNFMEFASDEQVIVNPIALPEGVRNELEASLLLCFTGQSRASERIIEDQVAAIRDPGANVEAMHQLKREALEMKMALFAGRLDRLAEIIQRGWDAKKRTAASISNPAIDRLERAAREAGATAMKISGAGGGGFMMLLVDPTQRDRVRQRLAAQGYEAADAWLTERGAAAWTVA